MKNNCLAVEKMQLLPSNKIPFSAEPQYVELTIERTFSKSFRFESDSDSDDEVSSTSYKLEKIVVKFPISFDKLKNKYRLTSSGGMDSDGGSIGESTRIISVRLLTELETNVFKMKNGLF